MTQEEKKNILLRDLCARLPYEPIVEYVIKGPGGSISITCKLDTFHIEELLQDSEDLVEVKPHLRPMSSMTEDEARDIAILHGNEPVDILSIKVTDEYIDIILDDGCCSTVTSTIWYDEIISSIECFDYLNKNMFDYRGLIPKDLALSTEIYNPYKDKD